MSQTEYGNINELEQSFIRGSFNGFPQSITIDGIMYEFRSHRDDITWDQIASPKFNNKALTTYRVSRNQDNIDRLRQKAPVDPDRAQVSNSPQDIIVFGWSMTNNLSVVPIGVKFTSIGRSSTVRVAESESQPTTLDYEEQIIIHGLNDNQPIQSKIDTGADMCSLHATNIEMQDGSVSFVFNGKRYTAQLSGHQTVKQADSGEESRPVVTFRFTIQGVEVSGECNLNDRTDMTPLLIGRNVLEQHSFNISTTNESVEELDEDVEDWVQLQQLFEDCPIPTNTPHILESQLTNPSSPLNLLVTQLKQQILADLYKSTNK